jgi:hypothetical protein
MHLDEALQTTTAHVKEKSELQSISDSFVLTTLKRTLNHFPPAEQKRILSRIEKARSIQELRKSEMYQILFKATRARLRRVHGMWEADEPSARKERLMLIKQLVTQDQQRDNPAVKNMTNCTEQSPRDLLIAILKTHPSTRERLNDYPRIYQFCFEGLPIPPRGFCILDLGCGMNIASCIYLPEMFAYLGYDLQVPDKQFLLFISSTFHIHARINALDLGEHSLVQTASQKTPRVPTDDHPKKKSQEHISIHIAHDASAIGCLGGFDVCFAWKLVDVLEAQERAITQRLLRAVPARRIVVSFATLSLGQNKRIDPRTRTWFVHFLLHEGWSYETLETSSELFFRIDRH